MSLPILVLGQSGTGKSFSTRNLLDDRTLLINVIRKPLPFKITTKFHKKETDSYPEILMAIKMFKGDKIVIDDSQYLMANEFMRRSKERGFDKFSDIGYNFWNLINEVINANNRKRVYFLHHNDYDSEMKIEKIKTIGKMLDEKITVEGLFSIVLKTVKKDRKYYFQTQSNGNDTTKTPYGLFDADLIDNDLALVDKAIVEYYSDQTLEGPGMTDTSTEPVSETKTIVTVKTEEPETEEPKAEEEIKVTDAPSGKDKLKKLGKLPGRKTEEPKEVESAKTETTTIVTPGEGVVSKKPIDPAKLEKLNQARAQFQNKNR